ncbi:acyl-CoA N-acyltransferase [Periconia macrospinosa]|uniref:Acyl-CoA N-acyltransferase n=1 Tax=Periconia macrospinosa TaxID=97972 RepID=A0A2V1E0S1_9PLEO|nr:acyl-CoA N-acyltransferase [Periconia macrospinosa]
MAIVIREATDADVPKAIELEGAAYAATPSPSGSILFPGPFPPEARQQRTQRVLDSRKEDPAMVFVIAVDEVTGEQMAFSKWCFYKTEEEAKAAPPRLNPSGPGTNEEACKAFFGGLGQKKAEIIGNMPHAYLGMLHTGPQYQKRGAASALLKWGLQRADELNLPVYLESSPTAYPLYRKHGFKDVGSVDVDLAPYGGEGLTHSAPCMVKDATKTTP